jgi:hypothetical protein
MLGFPRSLGLSTVPFRTRGGGTPVSLPAPGGALPPGTPSLWYDGSDIDGDLSYNSAYTDGDPVTTWVDKGSLSVNATQATGSAKPTYKASGGPGGSPYLKFDGGDNLFTGSAAFTALAQPNIIAALGNVGTITTDAQIIVDGGTSTTRHAMGIATSAAIPPNGAVLASNTVRIGARPSDNRWDSWIATYNSPSSSLVISGTTILSSSDTGTAAPDALRIGSRFDGTSGLQGGLVDVIVYDTIGAVTEADIRSYFEGETTTLPAAGTP